MRFARRTDLVHKLREMVRHSGVSYDGRRDMIVWRLGPMALGLMGVPLSAWLTL